MLVSSLVLGVYVTERYFPEAIERIQDGIFNGQTTKLMQVEAFQFYNVQPSEYPAICDLYKEMGVTVVRTSSLTGSLAWVPPFLSPMTYGEALLLFQKELHARGILHSVMCLGMDSWDDFEYGHKTGGFCSQVINNVNGMGDRWIQECNDYITYIQPDIFPVCDEFYRSQTDLNMETYIAFLKRCIQSHRQVKSNLKFVVMGAPFWNLKPIIDAGGIPNEPDLFWAVHRYYQHHQGYPPSYDTMAVAYWEATTSDELANAKQELINDFDNKRGIAYALSKGYTIFLQELGTHWNNPNYLQYMHDCFDYAESRNLDFGVWMPTLPDASFRTNVLTADLTALNEVGELASQYMTA